MIMTFGTLVKEAREIMHLSQDEAAKAIEAKYPGVRLSPSYLSMIETDSKTNLTTDLVKALCKFFSLPYGAANKLLDLPLPESYPVGPMKATPVYGEVRAGLPMLIREDIVGYEYISEDDVRGGDYFFLRVKGDSMIGKRICEGDLVLSMDVNTYIYDYQVDIGYLCSAYSDELQGNSDGASQMFSWANTFAGMSNSERATVNLDLAALASAQ